MNNELRESLKKLWRSLNQNDVQCMIVGGVAVGLAEFLPKMVGLEPFSVCLKRAKKITFDGNELVVIGYDELILNKKALDREIDRQDIQQLEKRNQRLK